MRIEAELPIRDGRVVCPSTGRERCVEDCRECHALHAIVHDGPNPVVVCVPNVGTFMAPAAP